jgi:hypothetical protein
MNKPRKFGRLEVQPVQNRSMSNIFSVDGCSVLIAATHGIDHEENAKLFVHVIDCHDELVEALRDLSASVKKWAPTIDRSRAVAALAKAVQQ